jgi:hypothetical protein
VGVSNDIDQLLREGIAAAKLGDKQTAQERLRRVVELDQQNEMGWFWLASVVENDDERRICLGNVVVINPNNTRAQKMLDKLNKAKGPITDGYFVAGDDEPSESKNKGGNSNIALIGGAVTLIVMVLILFVLINRNNANATAAVGFTATAIVQQQASFTAVAMQETSVALTETAVAELLAQFTATPTFAEVPPTLPPTWTPSPTFTPRGTLTGTPLATPPAEATGRIIARFGTAFTLDNSLPLVLINLSNPTEFTEIVSRENRGDYGVFMSDGARFVYSRYVQTASGFLLRTQNMNGSQVVEVNTMWGNRPAVRNQRQVSVAPNGRGLVFIAENLQENDSTGDVYYLDATFPVAAPSGDPAGAPQTSPTSTIDPLFTPQIDRGRPGEGNATVDPNAPPAGDPNAPTAAVTETATPIPGVIGSLRRLTTRDSGVNSDPSMSPDGSRVVFVSDQTVIGGTGTDLYVVDVATGAVTQITNNGNDVLEAAPEWSPDGTRIVYQSKTADQEAWGISVVGADGSNPVPLVQGELDNIRPQWSPDGRFVAFSSMRTYKWEIFIVDVTTGALSQLTSTKENLVITDWGR